ncbi:hypothetical protein [Vibrio profundi]|uniref:hypothetical protein n=1 Tax=Vibrio profundi TaxID=1774960 RepID=UPI0037365FC8
MNYSKLAIGVLASLAVNAVVAQEVTVNGFASVGLSQANNESGYAGETDISEFESESKLGIQGSFRPNDNIDLWFNLLPVHKIPMAI